MAGRAEKLLFVRTGPIDLDVKSVLDDLTNKYVNVEFLDRVDLGHENYGVSPDLVILDAAMPSLSGAELLKVLKDHESWSCPVLVLTSTSSSQVESLAKDSNYQFAVKPFVRTEMVERVIALLSHPTLATMDVERDSQWDSWIAKTTTVAASNTRAALQRLPELGLIDDQGRPVTSDVPTDMQPQSTTDLVT